MRLIVLTSAAVLLLHNHSTLLYCLLSFKHRHPFAQQGFSVPSFVHILASGL